MSTQHAGSAPASGPAKGAQASGSVGITLFGATGRIGQMMIPALRALGFEPRCIVRDATRARALLGPDVDLFVADMASPDSLRPAIRDGDRVFVLSPIHPAMREWQLAAIAAATGKASRLVKLSGSPWTQDPEHPTFSGTSHGAAEQALLACGVEAISVRPGVFADGLLKTGLEQIGNGDALVMPIASVSVAFVDPRDVAALCVRMLTDARIPTGFLGLTCPEPADGQTLARKTSSILGRPIRYQAVPSQQVIAAKAPRISEFELKHMSQMLDGIESGRAAPVADPAPLAAIGFQARRVEEAIESMLREIGAGRGNGA